MQGQLIAPKIMKNRSKAFEKKKKTILEKFVTKVQKPFDKYGLYGILRLL
ncbi:hypothetical protein [uncultured Gammaproteobacteria bacterium]|nr:hypothetical protein [uncultured Gammaproteobacteria bacterium]